MEIPESIEGWKAGDRAKLGQDTDMLFRGDVGVVGIEKVGAPQYGNERIILTLMADGTDAPCEVSPYDLFEEDYELEDDE